MTAHKVNKSEPPALTKSKQSCSQCAQNDGLHSSSSAFDRIARVGVSERKIEEFFLEEVPPPLLTGWYMLRAQHHSKISDLLDWKILHHIL